VFYPDPIEKFASADGLNGLPYLSWLGVAP
jgi:hypothetical protein